MFGRKLRAQIAHSSKRVAAAIEANGREVARSLHTVAVQQSREGNAAEVRNDLKLIEMGFSSSSDIPVGVPIRALWKPTHTSGTDGMERCLHGSRGDPSDHQL